jgi:hypothetical protein
MKRGAFIPPTDLSPEPPTKRQHQVTWEFMQCFPVDLWFKIFQKMKEVRFPTWLIYRTVCKPWTSAILRCPRFSDLVFTPRNQKIMEVFLRLQSATILATSCSDLTPFTHLRTLTLTPFSIQSNDDNTVPCDLNKLHLFTRLKSLKLLKIHIPEDLLNSLTNLTKLELVSNRILSISGLTNLTQLFLREPFRVKFSETKQLPHLKTLMCTSSTFFESGRGIHCDHTKNPSYYNGEWQAGQPHGYGIKNLIEFDDMFFEGTFDHGKYKKGVLKRTNGAIFEGTFTEGIGNGTWEYPNGDVFQGEISLRRAPGMVFWFFPGKPETKKEKNCFCKWKNRGHGEILEKRKTK